jgi:anti-anti-sigma factor
MKHSEEVMAIVERNLNNISVLAIDGVLGVSHDERLAERVRERVAEGARYFVFEMSGVPHIDSTGIAAVIGAYASITNAGGRLVLAGLTPHVSRVLTITRLLTVFEHCDREAEAVARLQASVAA